MVVNTGVTQHLWDIAAKGQFAVQLDITTPKPGNVHRYRDHPDTRFIHFAASIAQLGYPLYRAAESGYLRKTNPGQASLGLGGLIKQAVQDTMAPHGKNTLLGTILLLIPLSIATGYQDFKSPITVTTLQENITNILLTTTVNDAVELIRALQIANPGGAIPQSPEWTSKQQAFDFQSPNTLQHIRDEGLTLRDLQVLAVSYDAIAQEYDSNFAYVFYTLYPQIRAALNQHPTIEEAVLATYMWTLSQRPDTLIQRKAGPEVAEEVRVQASKLYARMDQTPESHWLELLEPFDEYLRSQESQLNPGTTADLLSGAIFLALILGDIKVIL